MSDKLNNIFAHTDCLSEDMLNKYVSGKLTPAEKHEVEKHLVDCEMCSDAVEGFQLIKDKGRISGITAELNKKIQERTEKKEVKVIFLRQYRTQLAAAASVALLVGLVWFFRSNMGKEELDPESANKIFTENFEPYPSTGEQERLAKDSITLTPDFKTNLQTEKKEVEEQKGEKWAFGDLQNEVKDVPADDKKEATKNIVSYNYSTANGAKTEDNINMHSMMIEKQAAAEAPAPVTTTTQPKADAVTETRDEVTAVFKSQESKPAQSQQPLPAKKEPANVTVTSNSGTTTTVDQNGYFSYKKDKEKDVKKESEVLAKNLEQSEKVLLQAENVSTKSGKDRSKTANRKEELKSKKATEETVVLAEPVPTEVSGNIATGETALGDDLDKSVSDSTTYVSRPGLVNDYRSDAMTKYEQQDFAGAAVEFERTLAKDTANYNALFYSAVSYLGTGETDKAITNLNKVLEKKDGEFYDAAKWYISLAYIKKNDAANARKNLTELKSNPKSKYQKKADETLREMKK